MTSAERDVVRLLAAFDRVRAGLREFQRATVRLVACLDQTHAALRALRRSRP